MSIEVRLGPREERMRDFEAGKTDVMFLSYTEDRAARYQLLDQTWTLAQVVMMRPGLPRYPRGLNDLWGLRIAVDQNSVNHQLLAALPESRRPALTVVATREDQIRAFERGEVDGVAGNHLTMRFLMGALADNAVEVPLISRPYHLAVLRGRENIVAPLRVALDRLKNNGEFDRLVEQHLSSPVRQSWLERYAFMLAFGGALVLLVVAGGTVWNRSLHRQVRARTKAVERTERRYRDLVDNASDMIYRTDPFGRFTFVNPVATRILGFGEGELLSMKYFELMRPDWVPRAMDFYEKAAKTRESTYLEFPVRKKDGEEIWVGQHVRPIITGGRIEGFQGMARDITDRVIAQSELRAERDFVSAILDTAPSLDHGARRAGPHRAFQSRLRGAVRRDDVGGRRPPVLGGSVHPRRRSRRYSRRHAAAGGVDRTGQARSRVARQGWRAARDRVDGHGAARTARADLVPDRARRGRDTGARAVEGLKGLGA